MNNTAGSSLERARRHVDEAERRVAEQRSRIDTLRHDQHDTTEAEKVLETFEDALAVMRKHLALEESERREREP